MRTSEFKQFLDRTVTLRMTDGEVTKVKINFLDDENEEIIGALVETSRPERYRQPCALHTFAAADIVSAAVAD